jgi:hypothetical protein
MVLCPRTPHGSAMSRYCAVLFGCSALAGCFGGQTGGELTGNGGRSGVPTSDAACTPQIRMLGVDEISPLGFAASDVLAYAEGTRSASLFWNANTAPLGYGPESGQSRIELSLEYRGGAVRSRQFTQMGAGGAAPTLGCMPDRLEIEVEAVLLTAGGALAESFPTSLTAMSPMSAQLTQSLRLETLNGSFMLSVPDGFVVDQLGIDATLAGPSFRGSLWTQVTMSGPKEETRGATAITFATWPSALSGQP